MKTAIGFTYGRFLGMIAHIKRRLGDFDRTAFIADRDEIDLTAFRLQVIGEAVRKLSVELKAGRPDVEWERIVAMRNFIAHDYEGIEIDRLWNVATKNIDALADACRAELGKANSENL